MKPALFLALALFGLSLAACEKKETPPPAASAASPTSPTSPAATTVAAATAEDRDEMPVEEDFEDEAEQKITAQNAEAELDKLEKEISE